ncbi:MAG TPA: tetratricopeptide repeat protein [Thermoanaerobaculia bacterium]
MAAIVAFAVALRGRDLSQHTAAQRFAIGFTTIFIVLGIVIFERRAHERAAGDGDSSGRNHKVQEITNRAETGATDAQIELADMFYNGEGVAQSYSRALYWYEQAAGAGVARAETQLGWMHTRGIGTKLDRSKAAIWFQKAASAGDARAQNYLGYAYLRGWGVPVDYLSARHWLEKSAGQNDRVGLYNYAWVHERGLGGPKDIDLAVALYRRSAALGYAEARNALHRLNHE